MKIANAGTADKQHKQRRCQQDDRGTEVRLTKQQRATDREHQHRSQETGEAFTQALFVVGRCSRPDILAGTVAPALTPAGS